MNASVIPLRAVRAPIRRVQTEGRTRDARSADGGAAVAAGIAHDLNNVLGTLMSCGEMLVAETAHESRPHRHAEMVVAAVQRGMDLVEQLSAYTRSGAIECTPTNACRAISGALDLVRCTLPSRIALHAVVPLAKLIVAADATQLHRLVMNLCGNAIHAMQQGGVLRVKLARSDVAARRALSHGTLMPGPYAVLSVEDEGCGMDRATLARMFEPFFTTRPSGQGSGLGLAVVKAIVGQCRGAIDVKSARSRGTTFTIYLRCIEPKLDIA